MPEDTSTTLAVALAFVVALLAVICSAVLVSVGLSYSPSGRSPAP